MNPGRTGGGRFDRPAAKLLRWKPNFPALQVPYGLDWRAFCCGDVVVKRVVLFVDYQNVYRRARDAFHDHRSDPHWMGQVDPVALGSLIVNSGGNPESQLSQVRIYRGLPDARKDRNGNRAANRQIVAWRRDPLITVNARPFRYPRDYPASPPQEKGIDVQLALDFAMMAVRGEYDVGVLMSNDTDLRPALGRGNEFRCPNC